MFKKKRKLSSKFFLAERRVGKFREKDVEIREARKIRRKNVTNKGAY